MENRNFTIYNLQSTIYNLFFLGCLGALLLISGCGGGSQADDSAMIRRAQLVGNENLELKKVIADKDKQIADLTNQLELAHTENAAIQEQHGDIYKKLLDIISECNTKLEKYEAADPNAQIIEN